MTEKFQPVAAWRISPACWPACGESTKVATPAMPMSASRLKINNDLSSHTLADPALPDLDSLWIRGRANSSVLSKNLWSCAGQRPIELGGAMLKLLIPGAIRGAATAGVTPVAAHFVNLKAARGPGSSGP